MGTELAGPLVTVTPLYVSQWLFCELFKVTDAYAFGDGLTHVLPNNEKNAVDYEYSKAKRDVVEEIIPEGWHFCIKIVPVFDGQAYLLEP